MNQAFQQKQKKCTTRTEEQLRIKKHAFTFLHFRNYLKDNGGFILFLFYFILFYMKQSTDGLLAEEKEIEKEKSQGLWSKSKANISLPSFEAMNLNTTRDYKRS